MAEDKKISKNKQRKIETVAGIREKLEKAKALFLTDYRGLTHLQLETLRKALKKVEAEYMVAKNTLLRLALSEVQRTKNKELRTKIEQELKNPTATLLAFGDEFAAIKELASFIKNTQLPKIKIGIFAGKVATEADFQKLTNLPTRDVLLSTLVFRMKSPIYGLRNALRWNLVKLVMTLDGIKGKKAS